MCIILKTKTGTKLEQKCAQDDDKFGKPLLTNAGTHEAHFSKKEKVKVVEISFSAMNKSNWGEGYGQVAEFAIHTYPGRGTKTIHGGGRTS